uniref:Uncharacterized protein n=1 Tax=Arundo donax TaxID=35708 RepID=A0A0A9D8W5_ARUDO
MICSPRMQISPGWFRPRAALVSGSTIFSSAFRTTVPHDPDFTLNGSLANARHIASTGPASVIPYPCPSTALGILAMNASWSSLPMGAAPDMTMRMEVRSLAVTRGLLAISTTIGGTKGAMVMPCLRTRSTSAPRSNLRMMTMADPARRPASSTELSE